MRAPAAKCHGTVSQYACNLGSCDFLVEQLRHGELIPAKFREGSVWCLNAGVMRLDPLRTLAERRAQVESMLEEVRQRDWATYLPEQYYLAEKLTEWRHIDQHWNWEVCPEWDDPGTTRPVRSSYKRARVAGWAGYYGENGYEGGDELDAQQVLARVRVWHFSGRWETAPWMFQQELDTGAVHRAAMQECSARDPGGVVAQAMCEWRQALDSLLHDDALAAAMGPLAASAEELRQIAIARTAQAWWCEVCGQRGPRVRETDHGQWACADCIVGRLQTCVRF